VKSLWIIVALSVACLVVGSPAVAHAGGAAQPGAAGAPPTPDAETAAADQATARIAQEHYLSFFGVALGVGFIIAGAAYGIARIAASSMDSMARQPEVAANIQMILIITTAMIEGIAFFALIICVMELFR